MIVEMPNLLLLTPLPARPRRACPGRRSLGFRRRQPLNDVQEPESLIIIHFEFTDRPFGTGRKGILVCACRS